MEVPVRVLGPERGGGRGLRVLVILAVITAVFLLVSGLCVGTVGVSEAAVVVDPLTGNKRVVIGPRIFLKSPWEYYIKIYLGVESLDMWTEAGGRTGEWPAVTCLTKDGLEVKVDITVRWRVNPNYVLQLYESYPRLDWESTTLASLLRETVRNIIASYTAVETIEKRAEISNRIIQEFTEAVMRESNLAGAILIEGIDLRNIELPERFKAAVEQKLAEEQQKLAAEFRRERMIIEANATATSLILKARGEAMALLEKAKGEAQAILIRANASAQAYRLLLEALGGNQTQLATIMALKEMLKDAKGPVVVVIAPQGAQVPVVPVPIATSGERD